MHTALQTFPSCAILPQFELLCFHLGNVISNKNFLNLATEQGVGVEVGEEDCGHVIIYLHLKQQQFLIVGITDDNVA